MLSCEKKLRSTRASSCREREALCTPVQLTERKTMRRISIYEEAAASDSEEASKWPDSREHVQV